MRASYSFWVTLLKFGPEINFFMRTNFTFVQGWVSGWNKGWKQGKTCFLSDFLGISSHCVSSNSFPFSLRYLEYKVGQFLWYQAYLNPKSCQNISSTFWFIAILVLGVNFQKTVNLGFSSHYVTSDSFPFNLRYLEYKVGQFLWYQAYLKSRILIIISSTFWFVAILVQAGELFIQPLI
jgi:hypothetical protein